MKLWKREELSIKEPFPELGDSMRCKCGHMMEYINLGYPEGELFVCDICENEVFLENAEEGTIMGWKDL